MTLLKFLRRRRAQQLADAQADLAIAQQEAERYRHALGCALVLASHHGASMPDRWLAWASEQWMVGLRDRSAVEVIDDAIGVDDDDELDGLRVTRR
ncbi:MAG: hypothetical protein J0H09_28160 [Burkholderiales bacterium]|nr:hypothetical protein [Burkholderiales bacterium]